MGLIHIKIKSARLRSALDYFKFIFKRIDNKLSDMADVLIERQKAKAANLDRGTKEEEGGVGVGVKEKKTKAHVLWGVILIFFVGFGMVSVGATKFPFSVINDYCRLIDSNVEEAFPFLFPEISTEELENGIRYMERNDHIKKTIGRVPTEPAEVWFSQKRVELGLNFSDFVPLDVTTSQE